MLDTVLKESEESDALIMAAAVADFRPRNAAKNKIKKEGGVPQIELEATEDILRTVSSSVLRAVADQRSGERRLRVVVGFAAESQLTALTLMVFTIILSETQMIRSA